MVAITGTPRARTLSSALREVRKASGVGVRELARQLSWSHAQISNWENGKRVPSLETVAMFLAAIRVCPDERERILDLARNVHDPHWLTVGMRGIPQQLAGVVECERAACTITEWSSPAIPGLLQTTDYTRAIKTTGGLTEPDIELRVMLSASRQGVIMRRNPVHFEGLIGEAALYEHIGSPHVLPEQLRHLVSLAARPNIVLRVIPQRVGWHPGWAGPFTLYEFPDTTPVVYFEHHSSGAFVPTAHDVTEYRSAIEWLRKIAFSPAETVELFKTAAEDGNA